MNPRASMDTLEFAESDAAFLPQWAREIGDEGSLKMFQRTPNLACPMKQVHMTKEEQQDLAAGLAERFADRNKFYNGFLYQWRENLTFDDDAKKREDFYWTLWNMVSLEISKVW